MRSYRLERDITVLRSLDDVFGFFADAGNLNSITPPWLHFRILTSLPVPLSVGTILDCRIRLHGIPIRWRTRIAVWEPPYRFVDEQVTGPYRLWRHEHTFGALPEGTVCRDVVDYAHAGGQLVHRMLVAPDLRRIFDFRAQQVARLLNAPGVSAGSTARSP